MNASKTLKSNNLGIDGRAFLRMAAVSPIYMHGYICKDIPLYDLYLDIVLLCAFSDLSRQIYKAILLHNMCVCVCFDMYVYMRIHTHAYIYLFIM
jgi:hypothetical protein